MKKEWASAARSQEIDFAVSVACCVLNAMRKGYLFDDMLWSSWCLRRPGAMHEAKMAAAVPPNEPNLATHLVFPDQQQM